MQSSDAAEHTTAGGHTQQKHGRWGGWRGLVRGAAIAVVACSIGAVVTSLAGSASGAKGRMN